MDETVLFPSPNWFQSSGFAASQDGWLIYGGPSKSLCVLQPLSVDYEGMFHPNQRFQAHVVNRAHLEKVVSVDISPSWPEKLHILTGSADGSVKEWNIEHVDRSVVIKSMHSHEIHSTDKEEVVGVSYSDDVVAITVGVFGNIVKWDLHSNVVKVYNSFLKTFKPTCVTCSPHVPLNVAIGTKQGVVFVLDLSGQGKILYKVRAQDDEVVKVSWCPQYEVVLRKTLKESDKRSSVSERMEKIRNGEIEKENVNKSGIVKDLPEDSFDESIVQEDDMFDIYKDHEPDEFGHKKYEPEDVLVKVKEEKEPCDFLSECNKLKEDILKRKNKPEPSIESLVEALENTHVDSEKASDISTTPDNTEKTEKNNESSAHTQKHLLATIGKYGGVRVWSKSGKLVASCSVPSQGQKNSKNKGPISTNIMWYRSDVLLIADGKNQLLECNPLKIDCKNKLEWQIVHSFHKRGLYGLASSAPPKQTVEIMDKEPNADWHVWTVAQDRNLVCYSMKERKKIQVYNTCGGFLYTIQPCPYDARKVAVSVGDGAVRVWEMGMLDDDDVKLDPGRVLTFWQNVQGKVLTIAWHPTRENLLAFATAEARVGLLDTSGKSEKPAKTLVPSLRGGVYGLCWGDGHQLYACGGGELMLYQADKPDQEPVAVTVQLEGKPWEVSAVRWTQRGLLCGSAGGAVAALAPDTRQVVAAAFVFNKMIHSIQMHPEQTSSSSEESPYKNLIAVSSLDKQCTVAILEYNSEGDNPTLQVWKTLTGHKGPVLQLEWSPHQDGQLVSTSQDGTVRVWDVAGGGCVAVFGAHRQASLGAAWSADPARPAALLTGGADCCLRVWDLRRHPPHLHTEIKHEVALKKEKKKGKDKKEVKKAEEDVTEDSPMEGQVATTFNKLKASKKFLLPIINRQTSPCNIHSIRKLARKFLEKENEGEENGTSEEEVNTDFVKIFGTTNEVNEILDMEMDRLLQCNNCEAWTVLAMFRGRVTDLVEHHVRAGTLGPFVVSLAPCVSPKYWKDVVRLYLAQEERLAAADEPDKLAGGQFGGRVFRRAALLLAVHDARAALALLADARLYKEAYALARARHMGPAAENILRQWAADGERTGNAPAAVVCHLALNDPYKASVLLGKSEDQEYLELAAELARAAGQHTLATHLDGKRSCAISQPTQDEELEPLPTRAELIQQKVENGDVAIE